MLNLLNGESICKLRVLVWLLECVELSSQVRDELKKISLPDIWNKHQQHCMEGQNHFLSHALELLSLVQQKVFRAIGFSGV